MTTILSVYADRPRIGSLSFVDHPSMAKQSFAKDADVNTLVAKYMRTGVYYDQPGTRTPQYGDFSELGEYRDVVERVNLAREHFADLPADVRLSYDNDVGVYLDALAEEAASGPPEDVSDSSEGLDPQDSPEASPEPPEPPVEPPEDSS